MQVLEHVTTALLHQGDKPNAQTRSDHARHLADLIQATYQNDKFEPGGGPEEVKRKEDFDRGRARALLLQARANGLLGHNDDAIQLAQVELQDFSQRGSRARSSALALGGGQGSRGAPVSRGCLHHRRVAFRRPGRRQRSRAHGRAVSQAARLGSRPRRPDPQGLRHHFLASWRRAAPSCANSIRTRSSRIRSNLRFRVWMATNFSFRRCSAKWW